MGKIEEQGVTKCLSSSEVCKNVSSLDTWSIHLYQDDYGSRLLKIRNRIKRIHQGGEDHITLGCLEKFAAYYERNHAICEGILSEREASIFGSPPEIEYSQPMTEKRTTADQDRD